MARKQRPRTATRVLGSVAVSCVGIAGLLLIVALCLVAAAPTAPRAAEETLTFDAPQCAGISGFRVQWDQPITVAVSGERVVRDSVIKDRGQSAVWGSGKTGPLAFDAVHRQLLIRFPGAAEKIADSISAGRVVAKAELVLPYLDEEIWPTGSGQLSADGYRYRTNWGCDQLYRAQRPNWHAVAHLLRKAWQADANLGPTFNSAINGAIYWKRFGATDLGEDRFPTQLGPTEVSSYHPDGRMDVTATLTDSAYGETVADRLRTLSDCGFIVAKEEVYDARYFQSPYDWSICTGPRAILIQAPKLVVTLTPGKSEKVVLFAPANVPALAAHYKRQPLGTPSAIVPSSAEVVQLNEKFIAKPAWMPDWQYAHVRQLMGLENGGKVLPFYERLLGTFEVNRARDAAVKEAKQLRKVADADYASYLAWLDSVNNQPPRYWAGHLTGSDNVTQWYIYGAAIPAPVRDSMVRSWKAWLMPERETQMDPALRSRYDDFSGKLVHPMVDDPRVGKSASGKKAEWGQGDTYYRQTGDWHGNKSFYRSGFTREMSTANFNSSASSGALLNGQIVGSANAMADGRAGLMRFPFWTWTFSAGVGQEYIDHYYWAIATAGNKNFADFCTDPEDKMAGWSIITKTMNDLAGAYHPNLKKLAGPASRTSSQHLLGQQDGLYHILHVLSRRGALSDATTGTLPALTPTKDSNGRAPRPISAWGHDYPPANVATQSMSGPWADPWLTELVDEKPLPWSLFVGKEGDPVITDFGENYGLSSIRQKQQRVHLVGHWRRKAELPSSMRDIGTLDMRIGFNQTQIANDGDGTITHQGLYRTYQHRNKLIMLARPDANVIAKQAGERQVGNRKQPAQEIRSVQCTAALFSYELPRPGWEIYIDDKKIDALPATAKQGQVITVHDGVSYVALRPLPTDDLGRNSDITLEVGPPQTQPNQDAIIQPALLVHANIYRRDSALPADALKKLGTVNTGFMLEMGDERDYGSFDNFQKQILAASLSLTKTNLIYKSGNDVLEANWNGFSINGVDPYADAKKRKLWQDTTLTQMGRGQLEKSGATIYRGAREPNLSLMLQTFPRQKIYVAMNLLPAYLDYSFSEPGGVKICADGLCSMGRWAVKESRDIDILYQAFGGEYLPKEPNTILASVLCISGCKSKPNVMLNGKDVTALLKPCRQDGVESWLVPLSDKLPSDDVIAERLKAATARLSPAR